MTRIILHIGTEKTGTSTIQAFLNKNREKLAVNGVLYPQSLCGPDAPSHLKLAAYARSESRRGGDLHDKLRITSVPAFRERVLDELRKELAERDYDILVMSSEHLSSRLNFPEEIERLHSFARTLSDDLNVVAYLRPQEELALSSYSTRIRLGSTKPFSWDVEGEFNSKFYDYKSLCTLWSDMFGKSGMTVRVFSKDDFIGGDLLKDFVAACKLPVEVDDLARPASQNESLGGAYLEFIRNLNVFIPHMGPHTNFMPDPKQGNLLKIISKLNGARRVSMSREQAARFRAQFDEGNAYVAREYLGRSSGCLFKPAEDGHTGLKSDMVDADFSMESAFKIFAEIWTKVATR